MNLYALFGYQLWSDGCTGFFSGTLLPACLIHDLDYSIGGDPIDKAMADKRLIDNSQRLGSVVRAYWFDRVLSMIIENKYWGESTIKEAPSNPDYAWRRPDFDIKNMIWIQL